MVTTLFKDKSYFIIKDSFVIKFSPTIKKASLFCKKSLNIDEYSSTNFWISSPLFLFIFNIKAGLPPIIINSLSLIDFILVAVPEKLFVYSIFPFFEILVTEKKLLSVFSNT